MDLAITLKNDRTQPLHQQLYSELRQAILSGRLSPGTRIPSTRSLAKSLGISRCTVTQSYDQLLSEGYIETIVGSGTFVCSQLNDDFLTTAPTETKIATAPSTVKLSKYGERISNTENVPRIHQLTQPISFRYGSPAFDQFPIQMWRKILSHVGAQHCHPTGDSWLDYSTEPLGYQPLREAIANYLSRSRAVKCNAEQILITNGTQQALDLILRLFIEPGEAIAVEDPGYLSARIIFQTHGAKLLPISVDESGLVVKQLTNERSEIRLVYVTPSHQFPTGAILSLPRRLELLAWAQQTGALIIEDDYDSEYRYGERPIPALQGLDSSESVLYIGTFSKVLFPSLRIGYLVLPKNLVHLFARAKWLSDRHLPILEQVALTEFIIQGHLERHIRKMRGIYDRKRQVLVQALQEYLGDRAEILGEKAGIHLMVKLNIELSESEVIKRAASLGVEIMSAKPHYLRSPNSYPELILGYGELTEPLLTEGIRKLQSSLEWVDG